MDRKVAASRCADYAPGTVQKALERAMALAPPPVARGKIVQKPNMLMGARAEKAVSTHPEILRAAIRAFRAAGASRIMVGESPGYQRIESAAKACGLSEVIEEEGAETAISRAASRWTIPTEPSSRPSNCRDRASRHRHLPPQAQDPYPAAVHRRHQEPLRDRARLREGGLPFPLPGTPSAR